MPSSSLVVDPESPMGKFHTPSKSSRVEICSLKDEVEDLRHKLREESVRKKSVLKDIESQTRQLQASEARMRVMESKLRELAQSKHTLASEKASCEKELLALKTKWDSAARKLGKIHETVSRAQAKISTAEKERTASQERVSQLLAELSSKQDVETKCIALADQVELANRQVEQLTLELNASKECFDNQTERTTEETQSQLYSLACTISQLRNDLEAEMNYSTARKTELSLLQVEKRKIEGLLKEAQDSHQASAESWELDRASLCQNITSTKSQLDSVTMDYDKFRESRDAQLTALSDAIRKLQDEIAQKDGHLTESEHQHAELEATYNALLGEHDSLVKDIESLHEDTKARQFENRRLDERVHFLESAMDYLRGEMSEKEEELEELKRTNTSLHERLVQQNGDVQSALAAQLQLKASLEAADEKIAQLESTIVSIRLEYEASCAQLDSNLVSEKDIAHHHMEDSRVKLESTEAQLEDARSQLSRMTETLHLVRANAEEAQMVAKEDLEAVRVELQAETQQLAHSMEKLAEREAEHEALLSAHDALTKAHGALIQSRDSIQKALDERSRQGEGLAAQNGELQTKCESLDTERASLETQLESMARELVGSQQTVVEQRELVAVLEKEVAKMKESAIDGEAKLRDLEVSLQNSQSALANLTVEKERLALAAQNLSQNVQALAGDVEALTMTKTELEQSLLDAEGEKEALIKSSEQRLKEIQVASEGKLTALQSELNVALESALDLMSSKSELAQEHENARVRITELETKTVEREAEEARLLESQRAHVNQINDLQSQIRSIRSDFSAAQLEHEKQVRILEECHQGRLEMEAHQHQLALEEASRANEEKLAQVASSARDQIDAAQAAHYKQMDSLHQTMADLKRGFEAQLQERETRHLEQASLLEKETASLTALLESSRCANADLESQVGALKSEVDTKERAAKELVAKLASTTESVDQLSAKYLEMSESAQRLSEKLSVANEALGELQVEKSRADSALAASRGEVKHHADSLAEMDSALANAQNEVEAGALESAKLKREVEELRSEMSRLRKSHESSVAHLQAEKKQWMELAESQKSEMDESFKLMRSAQDEVDALRVKYDALKVQRDEEEREMNDLRVKKLSHEVRMMTAELTRQKTRVQTRETAVASGKAREEKLQTNLDAQIEKCRDLQRQLADKDREAIIERGRAKSVGSNKASSTSTPHPSSLSSSSSSSHSNEAAVSSSSSSSSTDPSTPTIDEFNDATAQLVVAKTEISRLQKQLEVEKAQIKTLIAEQTKLTGHNNPKQKIQFTHRLMTENHELKLERANLLAQLEKKGVDSPHRKSLSRSIHARVRPAVAPIPMTMTTTTATENGSETTSSSSIIPQAADSSSSKSMMRIATSENEENMSTMRHPAN